MLVEAIVLNSILLQVLLIINHAIKFHNCHYPNVGHSLIDKSLMDYLCTRWVKPYDNVITSCPVLRDQFVSPRALYTYYIHTLVYNTVHTYAILPWVHTLDVKWICLKVIQSNACLGQKWMHPKQNLWLFFSLKHCTPTTDTFRYMKMFTLVLYTWC